MAAIGRGQLDIELWRVEDWQLEHEIVRRLEAIRDHMRNPVSDRHLSLEEIFRPTRRRRFDLAEPLRDFFKRRLGARRPQGPQVKVR